MKTAGRPTKLEPLDAASHDTISRDARARSSARVRSVSTARVRRGPLKIADAYLLRHVIGATARGLLWFAGLLFMFTFITAVRQLVNGTLNWAGAWDLVMSDVPRIFVFTLPMSVLFGCVQTFAELSSKGEITALQVGGMSVGRMMRMPFVWGVFISLCVGVLQERFVPATQQRKQNIIAQSAIKTARPKMNLRISDPANGKGLKSIVQAKKLDFRAGTMEQPSIQLFNSDQQIYRQISASRAVWNASLGKWDLLGAVTTDMNSNNQKVTVSPPQNIEYSMPSPGELGSKTMTLAQYLDSGFFEMASISDLREHRTQLQNTLQSQDAGDQIATRRLINSMTYGIHDKISTTFICAFLVLIGVPLALRPQRSGGGFAMGISLVVLMAYYVFWTWTQALGRGGGVNPFVFAYLPLVATATTGLLLTWKKARQ